MEVFIMVKRQKQTIFLDAKETTPVMDLKKILEGIVKKSPDDQRLYFRDSFLEDCKTLGDSGLVASEAKAQTPALIGLAYKKNNGLFEELDIAPVSSPELPSQLKPTKDFPVAGS